MRAPKSTAAVVFSSPDDVSEARRERVLQAASELGYTPNAWARSLRSTSGGFVGIIVADFHNPLFTEVADEARKALSARGHQSFMTAAVISDRDGKKVLEKSTVQTVLDLRPKGILIIGDLPDKSALKSVPDSVPIVIATTMATGFKRAIGIRVDESEAMRQVVNHLVGLGHKNLCWIGPNEGEVSSARFEAYVAAAKSHGLVPAAQFCVRTEEAAYSAATLALQANPRPTALVSFNDIVAIGVMDAIQVFEDAGGRKIAVTGFDNTYIATMNKVSLTSIEQEKAAIAIRAAEILTSEPEDWKKLEGESLLLLPRLEIRNSTRNVQV